LLDFMFMLELTLLIFILFGGFTTSSFFSGAI
jgi:hypothetical protein